MLSRGVTQAVEEASAAWFYGHVRRVAVHWVVPLPIWTAFLPKKVLAARRGRRLRRRPIGAYPLVAWYGSAEGGGPVIVADLVGVKSHPLSCFLVVPRGGYAFTEEHATRVVSVA